MRFQTPLLYWWQALTDKDMWEAASNRLAGVGWGRGFEKLMHLGGLGRVQQKAGSWKGP